MLGHLGCFPLLTVLLVMRNVTVLKPVFCVLRMPVLARLLLHTLKWLS